MFDFLDPFVDPKLFDLKIPKVHKEVALGVVLVEVWVDSPHPRIVGYNHNIHNHPYRLLTLTNWSIIDLNINVVVVIVVFVRVVTHVSV